MPLNIRKEIYKMKIVVKKEDAIKKVFKGVSLDSLALGEKSQVTKCRGEEFPTILSKI